MVSLESPERACNRSTRRGGRSLRFVRGGSEPAGLKVGYILGGTPRTIQIVEIIAVICASLVMYFLDSE